MQKHGIHLIIYYSFFAWSLKVSDFAEQVNSEESHEML